MQRSLPRRVSYAIRKNYLLLRVNCLSAYVYGVRSGNYLNGKQRTEREKTNDNEKEKGKGASLPFDIQLMVSIQETKLQLDN